MYLQHDIMLSLFNFLVSENKPQSIQLLILDFSVKSKRIYSGMTVEKHIGSQIVGLSTKLQKIHSIVSVLRNFY